MADEPESEAVDTLLDDDRFMAHRLRKRSRPAGSVRPSHRDVLRLTYLRFRYQLGYEALATDVNNNVSWRLFTRVGPDQQSAGTI